MQKRPSEVEHTSIHIATPIHHHIQNRRVTKKKKEIKPYTKIFLESENPKIENLMRLMNLQLCEIRDRSYRRRNPKRTVKLTLQLISIYRGGVDG